MPLDKGLHNCKNMGENGGGEGGWVVRKVRKPKWAAKLYNENLK